MDRSLKALNLRNEGNMTAMKALRLLAIASFFAALPFASLKAADDPVLEKISKQVEEEAAKAFNDEYKSRIEKEALQKYPEIKIGDNITVPVKFGRATVEREGTLKSISRDFVMVNFTDGGDRKIMKSELPHEMVTGIEGENYSYRSQYLQKNFYQAKNTFKKAVRDRLYQENGYIFDTSTGKWSPKSSGELPKEEEKGKGSAEMAPVKVEASLKELRTVSGEVYYNVFINSASSEGIEIAHSNGSAFIRFDQLEESLRKKFRVIQKPPSPE